MTSQSPASPRLSRNDILVVGDGIRILHSCKNPFSKSRSQLSTAGSRPGSRDIITTLVIGCELAAAESRPAAAEKLRASVRPELAIIDDLPRLRNVIVVATHTEFVDGDHLLQLGEEYAQELEAEFQRKSGVTLSVTIVVLDDDIGPDLLAQRIAERTDSSFSLGPFVVPSHTIRQQSLRDAEASDYL